MSWNRWAAWARRVRSARRGGKAGPERRRPAVEWLEDRMAPAVLTVNTLTDETNHTDGTLSLREAIQVVNSQSLASLDPAEALLVDQSVHPLGMNDTIQFATGLSPGPITLTLGSSLTMSRTVTIQGPTGGIAIDGGSGAFGTFSVLSVTGTPNTVSVTLNGLTVQNGSALSGGGIFNQATLVVHASTVTGNVASKWGGGIFNEGVLTIDDSTVSANVANTTLPNTGLGGGIVNDSGGVLTVQNSSVITNNTAAASGGGIENRGTTSLLSGKSALAAAVITNSTVSDNFAEGTSGTAGGGGVDNLGVLTVTASTFSNNQATALDGGGIHNELTLSVGSSTFTTNQAFQRGGALFNDVSATAAVSGSTFSSNYAAQLGGGLDNLGGAVQVINSSFVSNYGGQGGGAYNTGNLAVNDSTFFDNTSGTNGAGLANDSTTGGVLFLTASTLVGNAAGNNGGGVDVIAGTVTLVNVTATGNRANTSGSGGLGGGLFVAPVGLPLPQPNVVLNDTLMAANYNGAAPSTGTEDDVSGALGARPDATGALTVYSSHNLIGTGTGLQPFAVDQLTQGASATDMTLHVNNATLFAPGMVLVIDSENVTVTAINGPMQTITVTRAGNATTHLSGATLFLPATDNAGQVGGTGSNPNPINPLISLLGLYNQGLPGNLTTTEALLPGSPAINAGTPITLATLTATANSGATMLTVSDPTPFVPGMVLLVGTEQVTIAPNGVNLAGKTLTLTGAVASNHAIGSTITLGTDQRGVSLNPPPGGQVDIGAFESRGFTLALSSGDNQGRIINTTFSPLVVGISSAFGEPVVGGTVTFTVNPSGGAGATLNPTVATIVAPGTASTVATANGTVGSYTVTATTTGGTPSIVFHLKNEPPITIAPTTLAPWTVNFAGYNQTLAASGGSGTYTNYMVTSGALPTGLTLSSTGAVTGTPTQVIANDTFTVTATDSNNQTGSQQIKITINPAVTVTTTTLANGQAFRPGYSQTLAASGGTGAKTFALATGSNPLPPGLTLDPSGLIHGTPTQAGTFNFSVVATDSIGAASAPQALTLVINPGIGITPATLTGWDVNQPGYSQTLGATGATGSVTFSVDPSSTLPPGLMLNGATLSGKPTMAGTFTFTIDAIDSAMATGSQMYTFQVNPAPTLNTATLPAWTVSQPGYSSPPLTVTGGTAPFTFASAGGNLDGLTVNGSTGVISGTPTTAGTFNFTIKVTDTVGATATQSYSITINPAPSITTTTLPPWTVNQTGYTGTIAATGGTGAKTFALSSGSSLPPGLTLNANGTFSGAPTAAGTFNFSVTAKDTTGATATQPLTLVVNPAPTLAAATLPDAVTQVAYSQTLSASGGTAPLTLSVPPGSLPPGLSLNSSTGAITGTPTTAGTFNFTVTATDAVGATASQGYTIHVFLLGSPGHQLTPSFSGLTSPTAVVGTAAVTLSGQLSFPGFVPTGTVTIGVNGSQVSATLQADGSFSASLPIGSLKPGTYTVTYQYSGDSLFMASTASSTLQLNYGLKASVKRSSAGKKSKGLTFTVVLTDGSGKDVSAKGTTLSVFGLSPTSIPGLVVPGNGQFKFNRKHGGSYQLNLHTKGLLPGPWVLLFTVNGGTSTYSVSFTVR